MGTIPEPRSIPNLDSLPMHAFAETAIKWDAPERSGVYALAQPKKNGELAYPTQWVYVGKSENLRRRLLEHRSDPKGCIAQLAPLVFVYFECSRPEMDQLEIALIKQYQPPCNDRVG